MTKRTRRKIDAALKAKIALEALREQATTCPGLRRSRTTSPCDGMMAGAPCSSGLARMAFLSNALSAQATPSRGPLSTA
jgi:hypothetical protein